MVIHKLLTFIVPLMILAIFTIMRFCPFDLNSSVNTAKNDSVQEARQEMEGEMPNADSKIQHKEKLSFRESYLNDLDQRYQEILNLSKKDGKTRLWEKLGAIEIDYIKENINCSVIPTIPVYAHIKLPLNRDGHASSTEYLLTITLFEEQSSFAQAVEITINDQTFILDLSQEMLKAKMNPEFWSFIYPDTYNTPMETFIYYLFVQEGKDIIVKERGHSQREVMRLEGMSDALNDNSLPFEIRLSLVNGQKTDAVPVLREN